MRIRLVVARDWFSFTRLVKCDAVIVELAVEKPGANMDELQIQLSVIEQNDDVKSERDAITLDNLELIIII